MRELLKSIVLGLLVVLSLVFSYGLWYGTPSYEVSQPITSEQIHFSEARSAKDIIVPDRVIFALKPEEGEEEGKEEYLVFRPGEEMFAASMELIKELLASGMRPGLVSREEYEEAFSQGGLLFEFSYPYPLGGNIDNDSEYISRFLLPVSGNNLWMAVQDGTYLKMTYLSPVTDIFSALQNETNKTASRLVEEEELADFDRASFSRDIFLPEGDITLPLLSFYREDLDTERLLRVVFADMSLVRRIEEKDGAVIYTDGQKGLRIYPRGAVEYTMASGMGRLLGGEQALRMAGEIIALYGGWPDNLFLWLSSDVQRPQFIQQFKFLPYHQGRPLLSGKGHISLSMTDRGAASYYRRLLLPREEEGVLDNLITGEEALSLGLTYFYKEQSHKEAPLKDLYLGYYLEEKLTEISWVPVWVLEVAGETMIVLDAKNGAVLDVQ